MSASYYLINEHPPKSLFKIKNKLDYNKWCEVMESYKNITWDIDTKHGIFFHDNHGDSHYKREVYFDYVETPNEFKYLPGDAITIGRYTFSISFIKEIGLARIQFFNNENKKLVPLFYEISQKLGCYLFLERKLITEEDIEKLYKPL